MTEPTPEPLPLGWPNNDVVWCSCGNYYATVKKPLCPICLDDETRGQR